MNFYFVFEGKTEAIVYKKWLSVLLPQLTEVNSFDEVDTNNYYYESNMGYPDCYNVVANAIQDINEVPKYNYLVLCIDADRLEVEEKRQEAFKQIEKRLHNPEKSYSHLPENCQLKVIVQKVCIETWFLGNRRFFVRNPQSERLKKYIQYFDVSKDDPEALAQEFKQNEDGTAQIFGYSTKALFHESYLREIFKERMKGKAYHKNRPKQVQEKVFLDQLLARIKDAPNHLNSFKELIDFCDEIKKYEDTKNTQF